MSKRTTTGAAPSNSTPAPSIETIKLSELTRDAKVQARAALNESTITEYAEALEAGATFPPVIAFKDSKGKLWLADGFHRAAAHEEQKRDTITAEIRAGEKRDAILFACGANASHGLRRTNKDKRRAVSLLLADSEWSKWSDREIAQRAGVHHELVGTLRARLADSAKTRKGKDGKTRRVPDAEALERRRIANQRRRLLDELPAKLRGKLDKSSLEEIALAVDKGKVLERLAGELSSLENIAVHLTAHTTTLWQIEASAELALELPAVVTCLDHAAAELAASIELVRTECARLTKPKEPQPKAEPKPAKPTKPQPKPAKPTKPVKPAKSNGAAATATAEVM